MARRCTTGAVLTAIIATACSRAHRPEPAPSPAVASSTTSVSPHALLARDGYAAVPMQRDRDYRLVTATVNATQFTARLDTGMPFDLLLDPALELGGPASVHQTNVLSAYWMFTAPRGFWAVTDRVSIGATPFMQLETKVEPPATPGTPALLGGPALIDAGALVDYATDSLYLPVHPAAVAARPGDGKGPATLRAALEAAGRYRTFLTLMKRAGLMSLLEQPSGGSRTDSVVWLGLRLRAEQLSGVGAMPPNDVHLQLTRQALDRRLGRPGRHTAFVPTDAAFAKLSADTLRALCADTARLARLLRAHLFPGVAIDTIAMRTFVRGVASRIEHRSAFGFHVLGPRIAIDRLSDWNEGRLVGRATIVEADIRAANGIAHGIDRVLAPFAPSPLQIALAHEGYVAIPLYRRQDGNGYLVNATVDGLPVQLDIDTGAPGEIVLDRSWGSRLPSPASTPGRAVALDSISLGTVDVTTADFSLSHTAARHLGYRASDGVVGAKLLAKFRAWIDFNAGVLYLPKPTSR